MSVTLEDIREAADRIRPFIHRTPVMTSATINKKVGGALFFKCENFQKVGAFKYRGATNAVQQLTDDEAKNGVVAHSSGNHAQALALAARTRGIPAYIVMPENAPEVKKAAVAGYGAEITYCEPTQEARESTADQILADTGATFIHPYDNPRIIAGQGTAALELLEDVHDLDVIVTPIGGGGLISGTTIAAKGIKPDIQIWGVEPNGADFANRSVEMGSITPQGPTDTIADGLLTTPGDLTFPVIRDDVDSLMRVDDAATIDAMRLVWERMKIIIEPSSAVPIAALLKNPLLPKRLKVGVIITGGNVDLAKLPW